MLAHKIFLLFQVSIAHTILYNHAMALTFSACIIQQSSGFITARKVRCPACVSM